VPTVRPNAMTLVIDLAHQLAEEFDTVPLPLVGQAVRSAASAAQVLADDVATALPRIERAAREDLTALREALQPSLPA
jgi:hypothetical protein